MVRCLVAADGWRERVGGGDDEKRKKKKKKKRVFSFLKTRVLFCFSVFCITFNPSP
ncbi:hypothetical protein MtrunA17_Chr4g0040181 [Medicago truncatula]|uniref:Transmembrane protein n=1 Tax=Medicago truncatula TaxID=3880 RepID=A0A396IC03_MEDTR|nr:hypothetical protein MtrunA17_Chr4g0040181 [Medicago truncatula]